MCVHGVGAMSRPAMTEPIQIMLKVGEKIYIMNSADILSAAMSAHADGLITMDLTLLSDGVTVAYADPGYGGDRMLPITQDDAKKLLDENL